MLMIWRSGTETITSRKGFALGGGLHTPNQRPDQSATVPQDNPRRVTASDEPTRKMWWSQAGRIVREGAWTDMRPVGPSEAPTMSQKNLRYKIPQKPPHTTSAPADEQSASHTVHRRGAQARAGEAGGRV